MHESMKSAYLVRSGSLAPVSTLCSKKSAGGELRGGQRRLIEEASGGEVQNTDQTWRNESNAWYGTKAGAVEIG